MIGILILAIIITVAAIFSGFIYFIYRWTSSSRTKKQTYVVAPTKDQLCEFNAAAQHSTSEPIGVQPDLAELKTEAVTLPPTWAVGHYSASSGPESQDVCHTPVVSTYQSDREGRRQTAKQNPVDFFKETSLPELTTNNTFTQSEYQAMKPELTFSIFYDSASKELHVTVISASNLPISAHFQAMKSTQYYQVKVRVEPWENEWRATRHTCGSKEPVFRETFIVSGLVHHKLRECTVHFAVVNFEEHQHRWSVVGEVTMSLVEFRANQLMKVTTKLCQT